MSPMEAVHDNPGYLTITHGYCKSPYMPTVSGLQEGALRPEDYTLQRKGEALAH